MSFADIEARMVARWAMAMYNRDQGPRKRIRHPAVGAAIKNLLELHSLTATWDTVSHVWIVRRMSDDPERVPVRRFVWRGESVENWVRAIKGC